MAVNIDTVYQKVLAMANKEQRGYITPQEFNLYADQAQMDIFERYFHDISQAETRSSGSTEFSDSLDILEEKLSIFQVNDEYIYPTNTKGMVTLPTDLYRLGEVTFVRTDDESNDFQYLEIEVEEIKKKDIGPMLHSIRTRPTLRRPVYVRLNNSTIQVYPHIRHGNDSETWDESIHNRLGPALYFTVGGNVTTTSGSTDVVFTNSGDLSKITLYSNISGKAAKIIHPDIPANTFVTKPVPKTNTTKTITIDTAASAGSSDKDAYFALSNTRCNYIKKPTTPNWGYTEINGTALYNSGISTDFELHASEESTLVSRVLQLAGITLKDNNLLQIGGAEEAKLIQTQKQ